MYNPPHATGSQDLSTYSRAEGAKVIRSSTFEELSPMQAYEWNTEGDAVYFTSPRDTDYLRTQNRESITTITQLTISCSGTYCCWLQIPGWFNDQKMGIQVSVNE
ncbi:hypothetical protein XELAEV_18042227mg, partial [Xenopus laevis]